MDQVHDRKTFARRLSVRLAFGLCALVSTSRAWSDEWLVALDLGYANHSQKEVDSPALKEKPMAFGIEFDDRFTNFVTFGVELRKSLGLSPLTSGITTAEISARYYFLAQAPQKVQRTGLYWGGFSPWVSLGVGYLSAASTVNGANGISVTPKIGMDYTWLSSYFFRTEIFVLNTVASDAKISGAGLLFGIGRAF